MKLKYYHLITITIIINLGVNDAKTEVVNLIRN